MTKKIKPNDWSKHTDNAVVVDKNKAMLKVNECKVYFTDPKDLKDYEVDLSSLIKVFVNNITDSRNILKGGS